VKNICIIKLLHLLLSQIEDYLYSKHGVKYTFNEMIAIQTHDGLYDEQMKNILKSFMPEKNQELHYHLFYIRQI
jgi:hypothetical protein